jgi:hypothetical protein
MFVHHVFFWMKHDITPGGIDTFERSVSTLPTIDVVKFGDVGKPAGTNRAVIERSYSYSLLLVFEDQSAHDEYQVHPIHLKFVEDCSQLWERVLVYDSESTG